MQLVVSVGSFLRKLTCLFAILCAVSPFTQRIFAQSPLQVQAMKLVSGDSGWLLANGRLFWTSSLGNEWSEITPPASNGAALSGVYFDASGNGWAVQAANEGKLLTVVRTNDRGQHWSAGSIASPFTDGLSFGGEAYPAFSDAQHGWLMLRVASSSNFSRGVLFQTTDGGQTWTRLADPPVGGELVFTSATHGFAGPGARGDELFATTDGGQTWTPVPLPASADMAQRPSSITLPAFYGALQGTLLRTYTLENGSSTTVRYESVDEGATWKPAATLQNAPSSLHALAADGAVIAQAQAKSLTAAAATPAMSTFSTATQGLVLFRSGACTGTPKTCSQTTALKGTRDGGKTFFTLGNLPGITLESTQQISTSNSGLFSSMAKASALQSQMGFDKCEIMTTTQMQDWITNSPYRAVGAYIGGISRACTNVGFTPAWASTVLAQGWGIIPIWVGPQAPNSTLAHKITDDVNVAATQGVAEADAAVAAAAALGFAPGSVIYYDMEAYTRTTDSENVTRSFVNSWTTELHAKGYLSAIYSSHPEIQDWSPAYIANAPDAIWFAYFFSTGVACGTRCQNTDSSDIPAAYWNNHQRLRQTSSGFASTYGSTTATIDEDWTDGPVVITTGPRLTVSLAGTGLGTVTSADTFINCGTVCSAVYDSGTTVTLTAAPAALSSFISWAGCTSTSGTTCTVNLTTATTVTATFNVTPPVFTIASSQQSITWNIGGSAGTNITVSPKAPYQGVFTFACTNLPTYLKCAFSPATVTADGSGSTLTSALTLTAVSSIGQNRTMRVRNNMIHFAWLLPLLVAPMVRRRRKLSALLVAVLALALTQCLVGCGDSASKPNAIYSGSATVTVTSAGTSQQLSIPVVVNP